MAIRQAIRLAGGKSSKIVLIAEASSRQEAGKELEQHFRSFGATHCVILDVAKESTALSQLESANLIWMGGGAQTRLVARLPDKVKQRIKELYFNGCVVGGTSAGAAAMSASMITGDADLKSIRSQSTQRIPGLDLTDLTVDQHFHKRQRFNRLLSAVLDQPRRLGIGIDEKTAVILSGSNLNVVGESSVLILDARNANLENPDSQQGLQSVAGVKLHVIAAGKSFSLDTMDFQNPAPNAQLCF